MMEDFENENIIFGHVNISCQENQTQQHKFKIVPSVSIVCGNKNKNYDGYMALVTDSLKLNMTLMTTNIVEVAGYTL